MKRFRDIIAMVVALVVLVVFAACNDEMISAEPDVKGEDVMPEISEDWTTKVYTVGDDFRKVLIYDRAWEGEEPENIEVYDVIGGKMSTGQFAKFTDVTDDLAVLNFWSEDFDLATVEPTDPGSVGEVKPDSRSSNGDIVPMPGFIAGHKEISIPVKLTREKSNYIRFEGKYESDLDKISIRGLIYPDNGVAFDVVFDDKFELPSLLFELALDGWCVIPAYGWSSILEYDPSPIRVGWNPTDWPKDMPMTASRFLRVILNSPCLMNSDYGVRRLPTDVLLTDVDRYPVPVTAILARIFTNIKIRPADRMLTWGNIGRDKTVWTDAGGGDDQGYDYRIDLSSDMYYWPAESDGTFTYIVGSDNSFRLFINPERVFRAMPIIDRTRGWGNNDELDPELDFMHITYPRSLAYLKKFMRILAPFNIDGIPLEINCEKNGDVETMQLTFKNEDISREFLKAMVSEIIDYPDAFEKIRKVFEQNEETKDYVGVMMETLSKLPEMLDFSSASLGFNFTSQYKYEYWRYPDIYVDDMVDFCYWGDINFRHKYHWTWY